MAEYTDLKYGIPAVEDNNQTPNEPQNNYLTPAEDDDKQTPNEPQNNYPTSVEQNNNQTPVEQDNNQTPVEPGNNYPTPVEQNNNQTPVEQDDNQTPVEPGNNYPTPVQDDNTEAEADIRRITERVRTLTPTSRRKAEMYIEKLSKKGVHNPLAPKGKGIVQFRNKEEKQAVIGQCTDAIKTVNESPQGIAYPDSQITLGSKYEYKENKQYKIIGSFSEGNTADKVCTVQDLKTGRFHVMKIQDAYNAEVGNELKAMHTLRESGIVPKLFHFHMECKLFFHMEIIEGITLGFLQQTHVDYLDKRNLVTEEMLTFGEAFTLCTTHELFSALHNIHELGVAHNDIHSNNVILELPSMLIKYLDWGAATFKEDTFDEKHFRNDIIGTLSTGMGLWPDQKRTPKNEGRLSKHDIEVRVMEYGQPETGILAVLELLENIVTRNYAKETEFSKFLRDTMTTAVKRMDLMSKKKMHQAISERDPSSSPSSLSAIGLSIRKFLRPKIFLQDKESLTAGP